MQTKCKQSEDVARIRFAFEYNNNDGLILLVPALVLEGKTRSWSRTPKIRHWFACHYNYVSI